MHTTKTLFISGADFYGKFQQSVGVLVRNPHHYSAQGYENVSLRRQLPSVQHNTSFVFQKRSETYRSRFPVEFLYEIFDPKKFADSSPPQPTTKPMSIFLMPAPFAWIEIHGGCGTMRMVGRGKMERSSGDKIPSETYWMSKYPITNAQYATFMEAGGYQQEKWWTSAGLKYKQSKNWTAPRFWDNSKWYPEHPVIGVSWYEAVAFCLWLIYVTGEKIMLPTEAQWQYAAQGSDGRAYPWGNDWDATRCNHNVGGQGIGKTTPVTQFEGKGDSPFGVVDMAGNIWEWCLSDNDGKNNINDDVARVVRGGNWSDENTVELGCDWRLITMPHFKIPLSGFRIARA